MISFIPYNNCMSAGRGFYSSFTDVETEAQRSEMTCSVHTVSGSLEPRSPDFKCSAPYNLFLHPKGENESRKLQEISM